MNTSDSSATPVWRVDNSQGSRMTFLLGEPSMSVGMFPPQSSNGSGTTSRGEKEKDKKVVVSERLSSVSEEPIVIRHHAELIPSVSSDTSDPPSTPTTLKKMSEIHIDAEVKLYGHGKSAKKGLHLQMALKGPDIIFTKDSKIELALAVINVDYSLEKEPEILRLNYSMKFPIQRINELVDLTVHYPQKPMSYVVKFDSTKSREKWIEAINTSRDCTINRMYNRPPVNWNSGSKRASVVKVLNDFFRRRPTSEELEHKGILRNEPVFGSTIRQICGKEGTKIPYFVTRCVEAIESMDLEQEGIYRVAGNAALVQKLRVIADQELNYNLKDKWDIFVLTSALKTFLRELKEPLIPDVCFQKLSASYQSNKKASSKKEAIKHELKTLHPSHYQTLAYLFAHLHKVMERSAQNQMNSQNLALMFGPNLVWAKDGPQFATSVMFNNTIIEYLLLDAAFFFEST